MAMVGGARAGIGGVRLADGSSDSGGGGQCGCFPTVPTIVGDEGGGGLNDVDVSTLGTDETWVYWVESVKAPWVLDRSAQAAGLTIDNITITGVVGEPNSRWIRQQWQNPDWQAQTHWAIDHDNGDDENLGCGANDAAALLVPLRTTAEWRRRIDGAYYRSVVTVSVRRSNLTIVDEDDGNFSGFATSADSGVSVDVVGVATVLANGTGTLSAVQTRSANLKQTITDAAQTWAANGLVSSTTKNCMIRKTNGAWHAFIVQAISATEVMITRPTNVSETPSTSPGNTQVNPAVNDTYQVCSLTPWPQIRTQAQGRVRAYLLDYIAATTPSAANNQTVSAAFGHRHILCGWRIAFAATLQPGGVTLFTCNFASTVNVSQGNFTPASCGFLAAVVISFPTIISWEGLENLFVGTAATLSVRRGSQLTVTGILAMFDFGANTPLFIDTLGVLDFRGASSASSMVGSGNTGKLIQVVEGGIVYQASNILAATTDTAPYVLNGISGTSLPMVDGVLGGAIYL